MSTAVIQSTEMSESSSLDEEDEKKFPTKETTDGGSHDESLSSNGVPMHLDPEESLEVIPVVTEDNFIMPDGKVWFQAVLTFDLRQWMQVFREHSLGSFVPFHENNTLLYMANFQVDPQRFMFDVSNPEHMALLRFHQQCFMRAIENCDSKFYQDFMTQRMQELGPISFSSPSNAPQLGEILTQLLVVGNDEAYRDLADAAKTLSAFQPMELVSYLFDKAMDNQSLIPVVVETFSTIMRPVVSFRDNSNGERMLPQVICRKLSLDQRLSRDMRNLALFIQECRHLKYQKYDEPILCIEELVMTFIWSTAGQDFGTTLQFMRTIIRRDVAGKDKWTRIDPLAIVFFFMEWFDDFCYVQYKPWLKDSLLPVFDRIMTKYIQKKLNMEELLEIRTELGYNLAHLLPHSDLTPSEIVSLFEVTDEDYLLYFAAVVPDFKFMWRNEKKVESFQINHITSAHRVFPNLTVMEARRLFDFLLFFHTKFTVVWFFAQTFSEVFKLEAVPKGLSDILNPPFKYDWTHLFALCTWAFRGLGLYHQWEKKFMIDPEQNIPARIFLRIKESTTTNVLHDFHPEINEMIGEISGMKDELFDHHWTDEELFPGDGWFYDHYDQDHYYPDRKAVAASPEKKNQLVHLRFLRSNKKLRPNIFM